MPTLENEIEPSRRRDLLERYAPIVYHSSDENCFPTNVDQHLARTSLRAFDDSTMPDTHATLVESPTQTQLVEQTWKAPSWSEPLHSGKTRSDRKGCTFYLADVKKEHRVGSLDSRDWITYGHAYKNVRGGVTLQYWRFYAYNDAANNHGGDWEGLHILLDDKDAPAEVVLLGHKDLQRLPVAMLRPVNGHVVVYSEGGGHATRSSPGGILARRRGLVCELDPSDAATFVRHESWTGGKVSWFNGRSGVSGGILDVGSKLAPANGQHFVRYAGLWGSPGMFYGTSGYWGPAYNETQMAKSRFVTAWADGMLDPAEAECKPEKWCR